MTRNALLAIPLLTAATLWGGGGAQAHQVWLARDGSVLRTYLGEPVEDLRERSGGLLDSIAAPRVFVGDRTGGTGKGSYAKRRLVSTLSFVVAEGLPWPGGR